MMTRVATRTMVVSPPTTDLAFLEGRDELLLGRGGMELRHLLVPAQVILQAQTCSD